MIRWKAPFVERNGRFSPLKTGVFAALTLPALWLAVQYVDGDLDPKPVTELIHGTGDWALRILVISLAISPLRQAGQWGKVLSVRRMIGVAAFAYAFTHFCLYVVDQHYHLGTVVSEIALRFYLTIGFVTLLGLGALAATSTDAQIKKLGAKTWGRLHKLIYALSLLGLWHYFIQAKLDVSKPVFLGGLLAALLLYRFGRKFSRNMELVVFASLAAAPIIAALCEALWYHFIRHLGFWMVLSANWDLSDDLRPAAFVAFAAAGAAAAFILRNAPVASRPVAVLRPAE
jgi:methionine sulfoxide reductase heme-binding subunit